MHGIYGCFYAKKLHYFRSRYQKATMKGTFTLDPPPPTPTPLEFPLYTVWGACHNPPVPGISVNFQLGWVPSGKYICVKNIVALYYCPQKIIFPR